MIPLLHRYPLIVNPYARGERSRRALEFFMDNATRFAIYATRGPQEAEALAHQFAEAEWPVVVVAGGDGTLNGVMQGLLGSETALGIMPTGTMNVFAREMGIPADRLRKALEVLDEGHRERVDVFEMNGQPFLQMAGVGFDAQIIEETSIEAKRAMGPLAYLPAAIKVLGEQPKPMRVVFNDGHEEEGVCVLVGNGALYGGQFRLFGDATNRDELLDVVIFKESGYKLVAESLRGVAKGGITQADAGNSVSYVQASGLRIECVSPVPVELDGDLYGRADQIVFEKGASRLQVLAPKRPAEHSWLDMLKPLSGL